jgi:hypothetical protein
MRSIRLRVVQYRALLDSEGSGEKPLVMRIWWGDYEKNQLLLTTIFSIIWLSLFIHSTPGDPAHKHLQFGNSFLSHPVTLSLAENRL